MAKSSTNLRESDIECFYKTSTKNKNGEFNNTRENVICNIINNKIPQGYYDKNIKWENLRKGLMKWIADIKEKVFPKMVDEKIQFESKGGRNNSYDFLMTVSGNTGRNYSEKEYKIEFKYNIKNIEGAPQFSSPSNPDKFFKNEKYVEYYYNNYLGKIIDKANKVCGSKFEMPDKAEYNTKIYNNNPDCVKELKIKHKTNKDFNKYCNEQSKISIIEYLKKAELDTDKLSKYLYETQQDKHYMLYYKDKFIYDKHKNNDMFKIKKDKVSIEAPNLICQTVSGHNLRLMLRWKNGNGIAYPAFQISRKIPKKKELIELLKSNDIEFSKKSLVEELRLLLDNNNIIY